MSQYIGKTISLISVTENRYVGLLENIDSEKGTVTLNEVRCFGTEGRKNWGPEEIYPNSAVYKSVKFNGNEVKDLNILDIKLEDVHPVMPPSVSDLGTSFSEEQAPPNQVPAAMAGYGVYQPTSGSETVQAVEPVKEYVPRNNSQNRQNNQQQRQSRQQNKAPHKIEIPKEDFDFQSNNAKFSKEELEGDEEAQIVETENQGAEGEEKKETFYNRQSSFFDSISTSTETKSNMRWNEEKEMNLDTFGQASAKPRFNSGRGGYRGHGGRGRGRGSRGRGGRGGYNNFNNNNSSYNNGSNYNNSGNNNNTGNNGNNGYSNAVEF